MPAALSRSIAAPPQTGLSSRLSAERVSVLHWEAMSLPQWPQRSAPALPGMLRWVAENHRCNALLWTCQEQAGRTRDSGGAQALQRELEDRHRQRNETIDALDEALLAELWDVEQSRDARPSRETVGALIDRLSTNALSIFHLGLELQCPEGWGKAFGSGADRLAELRLQRAGLMQELDGLLRGITEGRLSYHTRHAFNGYAAPGREACANSSDTTP